MTFCHATLYLYISLYISTIKTLENVFGLNARNAEYTDQNTEARKCIRKKEGKK